MVQLGAIETGETYEVTLQNDVKKFRIVDGGVRVSFTGLTNREEARRFLLALSNFVDTWT